MNNKKLLSLAFLCSATAALSACGQLLPGISSVDRTRIEKYAIEPIFVNEGEQLFVKYGLYPQKRVTDSGLINSLNALEQPETNGWFLHNETYYAKIAANPCLPAGGKSAPTFDDGETVTRGNTYWFECEPIKWRVLSQENDIYYLLSNVGLDAVQFYTDLTNRDINGNIVYPNNYRYSNIRTWLNNSFYNTAFAFGDEFIQETTIDFTFADKVFLPSADDYCNADYGFTPSSSETLLRCCVASDYSLANGAINGELFGGNFKDYPRNTCYWTRSPYQSNNEHSSAQEVTSSGMLYRLSVVDSNESVRPAIKIKITR